MGNIGYIGIMENEMETTIVDWGYVGVYRVLKGLYRDNGT